MDRRSVLILSSAILLGAVAGGFFLSAGLQRFRADDRSISVRGFAEREVRADLAVWSLRVSVTCNDLLEGSRQIETAREKVVAFLMENAIREDETTQRELRVVDRKANEYASSDPTTAFRYIVTKTISIRSANVENIVKVSRMTDELLRAGVVISATNEWQGSGPRFLFTKLNEIKPDMLAEATKNARAAAEEFTRQSGTRLGRMRRANQGLFTIADRDEMPSGQAEGGYYGAGTADIVKKVRVVISVDYEIE